MWLLFPRCPTLLFPIWLGRVLHHRHLEAHYHAYAGGNEGGYPLRLTEVQVRSCCSGLMSVPLPSRTERSLPEDGVQSEIFLRQILQSVPLQQLQSRVQLRDCTSAGFERRLEKHSKALPLL